MPTGPYELTFRNSQLARCFEGARGVFGEVFEED